MKNKGKHDKPFHVFFCLRSNLSAHRYLLLILSFQTLRPVLLNQTYDWITVAAPLRYETGIKLQGWWMRPEQGCRIKTALIRPSSPQQILLTDHSDNFIFKPQSPHIALLLAKYTNSTVQYSRAY